MLEDRRPAAQQCIDVMQLRRPSGSAAAKFAFTAPYLCMLLQMLGLHALRFFSTLLPLLLDWCCEPQQATCLAALQALREVIKHTWPRMPAHASFLWSRLQQISTARAQLYANNSPNNKGNDLQNTDDAQIRKCIASIAEMLYLCGGSLCQNSIQDAWVDSKDPTADVMLKSIQVYISAPEQHS